MGRSETRLRLKQRLFLIHFLYRTNGGYTWELRKVKIKRNSNPNPNFKTAAMRQLYKLRDSKLNPHQ